MIPRSEPVSARRQQMVDRLKAQGIAEARVLSAMLAVPRERFVPRALRSQAYDDVRLPIGQGQTISQPWTVARLAELLAVGTGGKVLEIGTGSGYQAAVLAEMGLRVYSVERHADLARTAARLLRELGYLSITVKHFDGSYGWGAMAPFDGIVATAAAPGTPQPLVRQLAPRARLVVPRAVSDGSQRLIVVNSGPGGRLREEDHGPASFVPLIGRYGYEEPET